MSLSEARIVRELTVFIKSQQYINLIMATVRETKRRETAEKLFVNLTAQDVATATQVNKGENAHVNNKRTRPLSQYLADINIDIDLSCPSGFKPKSVFLPPLLNDAINVFEKGVIKGMSKLRYRGFVRWNNLEPGYSEAIRSLQNKKEIVIKKSDKGGNFAVLPLRMCLNEESHQLNDVANYEISSKGVMMEANKKHFVKLEEWKDKEPLE
ncbi:hypothetical protein NDU88_001737 [Pleurodeles waltl]|uniref:Uncharacterized protein n=1 Tax=Pleurodeles waltl TaxID=8319 RepID=A0AAV7Q3Z5_PLEWA|nr:hypothetical protein NDU88_001737 [Pleurodeles waltl]